MNRGSHAGDFLTLLEAVSGTGDVDHVARLIGPPEKSLKIAANGLMVALNRVSVSKYPAIAASIKSYFLPDSLSGSPANPITGGSVIQVRSSGDDEKDSAAKLGQSKSILYFIGAKIDYATGEITDVTYPTISTSLQSVHSRARSARPSLMQSMLQRGSELVKTHDNKSIYSKLASIHIVQSPLATCLLNGNF